MKNHVRALLLATLAIVSGQLAAQDLQGKPLRILVGFTAGGATDLVTRAVAKGLGDVLGQPTIVENSAGGGGSIALKKVADAAPDGNTLLMITSQEPVQAALHKNLPKLEGDVTPISPVAIGAYVLSVNPSVPANNVAELLAYARANPGKLTYGSPGIGSGQHMAGELFKWMANVDVLHVPYKGGGEVMTAVVGGQIDMTFGALPPTLPFVKAAKVKALAVTTQKPVASLPGVPTLNESGIPGYNRFGWFALVGPKAMPRDLVLKLNAAAAKALNSAEVREALAKQGLEPQGGTPEDLAAFIRRELDQTAKLVELAKVTAN